VNIRCYPKVNIGKIDAGGEKEVGKLVNPILIQRFPQNAHTTASHRNFHTPPTHHAEIMKTQQHPVLIR